jgi:xanthine/CO dehydrogenase XdhC/CoxF family maturation factor
MTQRSSLVGDCVEGEVLAIAVSVAAPNRKDDEGEDYEDGKRNCGGDYQSLLFWLGKGIEPSI